MWIRRISATIGFVFMILFLSTFALAARVTKETVILATDDQRKLECTYYAPSAQNAPVVILLPDTQCDKRSFGNFPQKLCEAGFAVMAMDFRYKDLIARAGRMDEQIRVIQQQNLNAIVDSDVKAALEFLSRKDNIDGGTVGVIGTSLGARVGIVSGAKYDKIKAVILISLSGEEALPGGPSVKELLEAYGNRPVLFMSSDKDWGGNGKAAENNRTYYDFAKGEKEIRIWPGSGHGVDILGRKEAMELVLSWLEKNLKK